MSAPFDRTEVTSRLAAQLERLLDHCDAPAADLELRYAPGSWSVREVIAHLADVEFINYWRFCRAVAEPGSTVEAFDQDAWGKVFDYAKRPISVSRAMLAGMRGAFLGAASSLPDATLENACLHPEKGRMSGAAWLHLMVAHTEHHLTQIEAARSKSTWKPTLTADSWRYGAKPGK